MFRDRMSKGAPLSYETKTLQVDALKQIQTGPFNSAKSSARNTEPSTVGYSDSLPPHRALQLVAKRGSIFVGQVAVLEAI